MYRLYGPKAYVDKMKVITDSMMSSGLIGASVSESHLGSSTRPLSVCLYIYIYTRRMLCIMGRA